MTPDNADRLKEYEKAFDLYLEQGRPFDNPPKDGGPGGMYPQRSEDGDEQPADPLMTFVFSVVKDNPQLKSQAKAWGDLLKEYTMLFVESMLTKFIPVEEHAAKEEAYIDKFEKADEKGKMGMMPSVVNAIHQYYKPEELNVDGYTAMMGGGNVSAPSAALVKDWRAASKKRIAGLKQRIIGQNRNYWEQNVKDWGQVDYEMRRQVDRAFYSYPQLVEIVKMMGRQQLSKRDVQDDYLKQYLPVLPSAPTPAAEAQEIIQGQSLKYLLPIETAIMSEPETELLFYQRFAARRLQLFANRPKIESAEKRVRKRMEKPRLEKGPMIVAIDTSASMNGKPIALATTLLYQLIQMARQQNRNCFLISFSIRTKCIDLSKWTGWRRLDNFMQNSYSGGTFGEEMLAGILQALNTKNYSMADALIISDFAFPLPQPPTRKSIKEEQKKGTCFYGLKIGLGKCGYDEVLDKTWSVKV